MLATREMAVRAMSPSHVDDQHRTARTGYMPPIPSGKARVTVCAARTDGEFDFSDESWFKAVRFGSRLSERDQKNKEIGLNWGGIAAPWAGG